eukprot:TRINITY_DN23509_c0_g1_i3.p1 TRINITY_DN23509_c0_g1~~TRINITY_DN23509_c0_g1_i3.p1  ORF type:complete len:363 (+),score=92.75 TRINITY_DN23509_c0_g1_i3:368-1456(+)
MEDALRMAEQRNEVLHAASIKKIKELQEEKEAVGGQVDFYKQQHEASILAQTEVARDLNLALQHITSMGHEMQAIQESPQSEELEHQLGGLMEAHDKVQELLRTQVGSRRLVPQHQVQSTPELQPVGEARTRSRSVDRVFRQYAARSNQRGESFDQIGERAAQMDLSEFVGFASEYGLVGIFSVQQLREMFSAANLGEHSDDRRNSLDLMEFGTVLEECAARAAVLGKSLPKLSSLFQPSPSPSPLPSPSLQQPSSSEPAQEDSPHDIMDEDTQLCYTALCGSHGLLKQANTELQLQLDGMKAKEAEVTECDLLLQEALRVVEELADNNHTLSQETLALRSQLARSMLDCQQLRKTPRTPGK